MRLASYNIRKAVGLDWRRDPNRSVKVIAALGADVVALQEVDKRLGPRPAALERELIARETDLEVVPVSRSPVSLGWHGNALLVRKNLDVRDVGHIELPGIEPRGAVFARIGTPRGVLTVVGVHLGLRRGCRRLQFAQIMEEFDEAAQERTVILGDFNEWSGSRGIEGLPPSFEVVSPGRSFHAARPVACLDRFALGPGVRLIEAGVERGIDARVASDHLPVWADLDLAEEPSELSGAESVAL
ncbi:endonuclease/exonuclease/phosphatase family protein [Rhodobacteraceae bacterium MCCB 386]|nr:endonuclease/exonuclease/phosphatase family protein [Roseitranquillus sediminis]